MAKTSLILIVTFFLAQTLYGTEIYGVPKIIDGDAVHINNKNFPHGYIRTALGAFYNHSDNPNCKNVAGFWHQLPVKYLMTVKPIKAGEELTASYSLYNDSRFSVLIEIIIGKIITICATIIIAGVYKISKNPNGPLFEKTTYKIRPTKTGGNAIKELNKIFIITGGS